MRIILFILIIFACHLQAQPGFSKLYEMGAPGAGFHNIMVDDDTLFVVGTAKSENTQQWGLLLSKFDTLGNLLYQKVLFDSLGDDYVFELNYSIIRTSDGNIAVTGNLWYKNWGFMAKLSKNGDLLLWKEYPEPDILNFQYKSILELPDGFIIAGTKQLGNYRLKAFVQKINHHGEVIWEKKYGNQLNDNFFGSIEMVDSNTFLIGSSEQSYPWLQPYIIGQDWTKCWLFTIDSLGNIKNEFKSGMYDESTVTGIHHTNDGGYIYTTWETKIFNQWNWGARTKIVKRDSNLNLVWSHYLSPTTVIANFTIDLKPAQGGNWIALGKWANPDSSTYGWPGACLYKISADGDSIWSRCDTVLGEFYSSGDLGGFVVLPTGSIIAAGKVNRYSPSGSRTMGWLFKVDKNGCLNPLCDFVNTQSYSPSLDAGFNIYPNPTDDLININTLYPLPFDVKWFDALGRGVFEQEQVSNHLEIDISAWKNGVYFVALTMGGKCILRKVVKL